MTSYSSVESAIEALRNGAVDYIIKPFNNDDFLHAVARALSERRIRRENALLKRSLRKAYADRRIIGESAASSACTTWCARWRRRTPTCSSRARAAPARSWWRAASTAPVAARRGRSRDQLRRDPERAARVRSCSAT